MGHLETTIGRLKARVVAAYAPEPTEHALAISLVAFGFKYGLPPESDLVFDVRFLPNPNYVDALRPLTGHDEPVAEFLLRQTEVEDYLEHLFGFLDFLVPRFANEGKSRLTIAIGCTGGRHRSVYIVDRLAQRLRAARRSRGSRRPGIGAGVTRGPLRVLRWFYPASASSAG